MTKLKTQKVNHFVIRFYQSKNNIFKIFSQDFENGKKYQNAHVPKSWNFRTKGYINQITFLVKNLKMVKITKMALCQKVRIFAQKVLLIT